VKSKPQPSIRLYLDSNIFLNVWFREMIKKGTVFRSSKRLLESILECRYTLFVSMLTLRELSSKTDLPEAVLMDEYLKPFTMIDKLDIIRVTAKVAEEAAYMHSSWGIHMMDAIHAVVAKQNNCILVTRDNELVEAAKSYGVRCVEPEELI
jgi:predicted nucleic acid-binding protein